MNQTFEIPLENKGKLFEKVQKINKKAVKLGMPLVTLEWGKESFHSHTGEGGVQCKVAYIEATVTGETPMIAGWKFLASLEHFNDDGKWVTIVRTVPGEEVPERFRTLGPMCEHCKQLRWRNQTYVLTDGVEFKAVGSSCLSDFTGAGFDPEAAAQYCEALLSLSDDPELSGGGNRSEWWFELVQFLAVTAACIRLDGWVSRTMARNDVSGRLTPTASNVLTVLTAKRDTQEMRDFCQNRTPTDEDLETARASVRWVEEVVKTQSRALSDYEFNVVALQGLGRVNFHLSGIAASVVSGYLRWFGKEIIRRKAAETSNHFGEVGKREVFELTLTDTFNTEGQFGMTWIYKFIDKAGNRAVWFSSKDCNLKAGETYKVKGTVKAHKEFKGVKETAINRCAIL